MSRIRILGPKIQKLVFKPVFLIRSWGYLGFSGCFFWKKGRRLFGKRPGVFLSEIWELHAGQFLVFRPGLFLFVFLLLGFHRASFGKFLGNVRWCPGTTGSIFVRSLILLFAVLVTSLIRLFCRCVKTHIVNKLLAPVASRSQPITFSPIWLAPTWDRRAHFLPISRDMLGCHLNHPNTAKNYKYGWVWAPAAEDTRP